MHAVLTLRGSDLSVSLWAERPAIAEQLQAAGGGFAALLADQESDARTFAGPRRPAGRAARARSPSGEPRDMNDDPKTPIAVALEYETGNIPRVTAKGRGAVAEAIIAKAEESGVHVEENAALAQALSRVDLDAEIPEQLFRAVAAVISFVLRTGKLKPRQ